MNPERRVAPGAAVPVSVAVVTLLAAVVPVLVGGAGVLPASRAVVEGLLVLSVAGVLGVVAVAAIGRVPDDERRGRLLDTAAALAAAWTVLAAGTAFLLYLDVAPAPDSPAFGPGLVSFIADVPIGRTWVAAAACAAVLTALLVAVRSRTGVLLLCGASLVAVVPIALQSATGGEPLVMVRVLDSAGFVQLLALATWLGALVVGGAGAVLPVVAAGAALIGAASASPALVADRAVDPLSVVGAVLIALAGVLAVGTAVTGRRSATGQVGLLAAGIGLGIASSITRAAPDVPARTTPAQILTGASLPPAPSFASALAVWAPDPLWLVVAGLLVVGAVVLARRSGGWSRARVVCWFTGVVLLVWLTSGAPAVYLPTLLVAALVQTAGLLLVVPLLLVSGRPRGALPDALRTRVPARPVVAAVLAVVVPLALVATDLLRWSAADAAGRQATGAVLLLVGVLLVASLTAPGVRRSTAVLLPVVLLVVETAAAVALAVGPGLLLADWYGAMGWGTDALGAQRAAALPTWLLTVVPTGVLLAAGLRRTPAVVLQAEAVAA